MTNFAVPTASTVCVISELQTLEPMTVSGDIGRAILATEAICRKNCVRATFNISLSFVEEYMGKWEVETSLHGYENIATSSNSGTQHAAHPSIPNVPR